MAALDVSDLYLANRGSTLWNVYKRRKMGTSSKARQQRKQSLTTPLMYWFRLVIICEKLNTEHGTPSLAHITAVRQCLSCLVLGLVTTHVLPHHSTVEPALYTELSRWMRVYMELCDFRMQMALWRYLETAKLFLTLLGFLLSAIWALNKWCRLQQNQSTISCKKNVVW